MCTINITIINDYLIKIKHKLKNEHVVLLSRCPSSWPMSTFSHTGPRVFMGPRPRTVHSACHDVRLQFADAMVDKQTSITRLETRKNNHGPIHPKNQAQPYCISGCPKMAASIWLASRNDGSRSTTLAMDTYQQLTGLSTLWLDPDTCCFFRICTALRISSVTYGICWPGLGVVNPPGMLMIIELSIDVSTSPVGCVKVCRCYRCS